jgi:hypothetical protein
MACAHWDKAKVLRNGCKKVGLSKGVLPRGVTCLRRRRALRWIQRICSAFAFRGTRFAETNDWSVDEEVNVALRFSVG